MGLVLAAVAFEVGRDSMALLVGEAAHPEEEAALRATFAKYADAVTLVDLLTMRLGPDALLVAARIDLADNLTAGAVELLVEQIEQDLVVAVPAVTQVFLHPTCVPPTSPAAPVTRSRDGVEADRLR